MTMTAWPLVLKFKEEIVHDYRTNNITAIVVLQHVLKEILDWLEGTTMRDNLKYA